MVSNDIKYKKYGKLNELQDYNIHGNNHLQIIYDNIKKKLDIN